MAAGVFMKLQAVSVQYFYYCFISHALS